MHERRKNARQDALQARLAHAGDRRPQSVSQQPSAPSEAEARLQSVFRSAPVGIGLVVNRVLLEVNDRLCEMVGYSQEELFGQNARLLYPSDEDYDYVGSEKYRRIQEHGTGTVETRWRRKDGAIIDVLLSSTPLDLSDLSQGVTFTALDITEPKKAEIALRESEMRFRELAEMLPQTVFETDANGVFTFGNRAGLEMFGYSAQELSGMNVVQLFVPEDRDRIARSIQRRLSDQPADNRQYQAQRKDGSTFPMLVCASPILRDGKPVGLRGIGLDITEQQRAERALQESKAKLESILESSPYAITVTDMKGTIVDCNQATLETHGLATKDELLGRSAFDLMSEEDRSRAVENMRKTLEQGRIRDVEYTLLKKDGQEFPAELSASLIRDHSGDPAGFVAVTADITERKQAAEASESSRALLASIFDSVPTMLLVVDSERRVCQVNRAARQAGGPTEEDSAGLGPGDLLRCVHSLDSPDGCGFGPFCQECTIRNLMLDTLETGCCHHQIETVLATGSAEQTEERILEISTTPIVTSETSTILVGISDITERKRSEAALRESMQTSSDILASIPSGMFIYKYERPDTLRLVDGNPAAARLTGLDIPHHIGCTFDEIWPRAGETGLTDKYLNVMKTGETFETEEFFYEDDKLSGIFSMRVFRIPGDRLCVAFENVTERRKADQKLQAYQKKLKSLASELSLAEEQERRRMAAGLHDHACQNLVLSKMKLQSLQGSLPSEQAQTLMEVCQTLDTTIESVRELTFDLSSPTLYKFGLSAAIEELLKDKLKTEHDIHYRFADDGQSKPSRQDVLVLLYQSVRELLINVIKHAQAREVSLDITREKDSIKIVLTDDGVGFDVGEVLSFRSSRRSVGLFHILERLDYIGGKLDMASQPGRGSQFTLIAPLVIEAPVAKEPNDGSENSTC